MVRKSGRRAMPGQIRTTVILERRQIERLDLIGRTIAGRPGHALSRSEIITAIIEAAFRTGLCDRDLRRSRATVAERD